MSTARMSLLPRVLFSVCSIAGLPALAGAVAAQAAPKRSGVPVEVRADDAGHGWDVRVSFKGAPETFALGAHAWTLEGAQAFAHEFQQRHAAGGPGLAAIRIEGKDGDGEIRAGQGPHLTDWPFVEQDFRARAQVVSPQIDRQIKDIGQAYQAAADATAQLFRRPQPMPSPSEQKALEERYQDYNNKVGELAKDHFRGEPPPLPKLNPLPKQEWEHHAASWAQAKRTQHTAEHLGRHVGESESVLKKLQQALGKEFGREINEKANELKEAKTAHEELKRASNEQQSALRNKLADSSAVLPKANGFSSGPNGAIYNIPTERVVVVKTDADGKPLPEDKQPPGYPKPFAADAKLFQDEKKVVDPNLRVLLLDREADVQANVTGKVVEVDKQGGSLKIQVDERGTTLEYSNLDLQGVKVGDMLQPTTRIGRARPAPADRNVRELQIRAWTPPFGRNGVRQPVDPGDVLKFGTLPVTEPNSLRRAIPEAEATPLPVKELPDLPPEAGKGEGRKWLDYDESITKEQAAKERELNGRETLQKAQLERRKNAEKDKTIAYGNLAAKRRQAENEKKAAEAAIADLKKKAQDLEAKWKARQAKLDAELARLRKEKKRLEDLAPIVKASKNNGAIDKFNAEATKHNNDDLKYKGQVAGFEQEKKDARRDLEKQYVTTQGQQKNAAADLAKLGPMVTAAQAALDRAREGVRVPEAALKAIAAERAKNAKQKDSKTKK